ncbi:MAG: secretin N-terminal domain-containing protein [Sedimenticola sp.]
MLSRLSAMFLLILTASACLADYPLEIIELKNRPIEEVIPIIRPFVGDDGAVTGMHNQLIIRTSPSNLNEIRKILQKIDRPARRLVIHVRQGSFIYGEDNGLSAGIRAADGDNEVTIGSAPKKPGARLRIKQARTNNRNDATHTIQTLEGKAAFIETGRSFPVQERSLIVTGDIIGQQTTTRYRKATSGFYVTPYLASGDRITLHITPFASRPGTIQGTYDVQEAETTVTGYIGEWIPIGGVTDNNTMERSGLLKRHSTENRQNRQIHLLVEEITH